MEFNGKIAEVTIEQNTERVTTLNFSGFRLSFRCQRCAVFCCKMGAPMLLTCDIKRLKQVGRSLDMFLDIEQANLKNKKDGSCIFLSYNAEEGSHQCSVYDDRPTFCRLYPFKFEKSGPRSYTLNFIPCCNGLNTQSGEEVDEKFFVNHLQKALFKLINSKAI